MRVQAPEGHHAVHKHVLDWLTPHALKVEKDGPLRARFAHARDEVGQEWTSQLVTQPSQAGAQVHLRAQPGRSSVTDHWPPAPVREVAAQLAIKWPCFVGPSRIEPRPLELQAADVPGWANGVLRDKSRVLPVVVLAQGEHATLEAARSLAHDLLGLALVVRLANEKAAEALHALLGKNRDTLGEVSLYLPGFDSQRGSSHDLAECVTSDWALANEVAGRILPPVGSIIERPALPMSLRRQADEIAQTMQGRVSAQDRVLILEAEKARLEAHAQALDATILDLKAKLHAAEGRIRTLEKRMPKVKPEGLPWELQNPEGWDVHLEDGFKRDVDRVSKDAGLAEELRKKMEAALRDPEHAGDPMRAEFKGIWRSWTKDKWRLGWRHQEDVVRFVFFKHKEDPAYSQP